MQKTNHTIYTERAKKLVIAANHFVSSANFSRSFRHDPKMRSSVTRVTRLSIKFMYAVGKIMFWVVVFFSFFLPFFWYFHFKYFIWREQLQLQQTCAWCNIWWMDEWIPNNKIDAQKFPCIFNHFIHNIRTYRTNTCNEKKILEFMIKLQNRIYI